MNLPPYDFTTPLSLAEGVTIEDFGDELVLFNGETRKAFLANKTGRLVVLTIQAGQPISLLVTRLAEVSGDREGVERDISSFVNDARTEGVLVVKSEG